MARWWWSITLRRVTGAERGQRIAAKTSDRSPKIVPLKSVALGYGLHGPRRKARALLVTCITGIKGRRLNLKFDGKVG